MSTVLSRLTEKFGDAIAETHSYRGDDTAVVDRARIQEVLTFLRDDTALAFDLPVDVTAVDWLHEREIRFDVVYHLHSTRHKQRVRIKCPVPVDDCRIATSSEIYPGFGWFERETYDMYGIEFVGHADLRRMFMYDEFVGHPLRKDYPKEKRQPLLRCEDRPRR